MMKVIRSFPVRLLLVAGLIVGLHFLHAQNAVPVQSDAASLFPTGGEVPVVANNYQGAFGPASVFPTNSLWLRIASITNGMANLVLNNATDTVYEVLSKTDLTLDGWSIEPGEVWPTNPASMPFMIPILGRTNLLFIRARDWTGVTENGNTIPDWWFWKYFRTLVLSDTNLDTTGNTLLHDYQYEIDPLNPADYYNGWLPELEIIGGNNQSGFPGSFLSLPLIVRVTDSKSNVLFNAPVTLSVSNYAQLATTTNGALESLLRLRADSKGLISAWVYIPAGSYLSHFEIFVWVSAESGSNTVQTNFTVFVESAGGVTPMLAVGGERIMELFPTGDLVSWGGNRYGELGDYTYLASTNAVHVIGLTNLIKIVSGLNHSLALDSKGTVWAWGENGSGELGDGGPEVSINLPQQVPGMTNTVAIAAHGYIVNGDPGLSLAVEADGTVWAWGTGNGYLASPSPVQITGASNMISVAAGAGHALALKSDSTVWAWGADNHGQLGDGGAMGFSDMPVQVSGLSNIVALCAGDDYSLALDVNGCVWAWGCNSEGQLGDGGTEIASDGPVMVGGLTNIVAVATGASFSLALDQSGKLWAWGSDNVGQLGDGGSASINLPIPIPGLSNIISMAAGSDAAVALDGNGHVWQWGSSDGDGTNWVWGDENGAPRLAPSYSDFFNGQLPVLTILQGNDQVPHAGMEFPQPLVFDVTDTNGAALSNAPVSVEVISGDMELRTVSGGDDFHALRLTTDAHGAVTLIGYADRYINDPNCVIRVLAASGERMTEVDFEETLIPAPTITITSPVDGESDLIGPNESLAITVDTEPAPGASIREVDYSYQTDGDGNLPLGISTQSPYSFTWTNSLWWTNAFVGQYTVSTVAVDNAGAQSDPQLVNFTIALDSDRRGLPDYWQLQYFGHLGMDPDSDPEGNGRSLRYDYQNGMDPTDYYNGVLPNLTILSGNDQDGKYDSFLPLPVIVAVTSIDSSRLTNAPVTFIVTNGTALLASSKNDTPAASLALRTDATGQVLVWVYFPPANSNAPDSTIVASAFSGNNSVTDAIHEFIPLAYWRFDDTNTWVGEEGQMPLLATNVTGVSSWSSHAVLVEGVNPSLLAYNVVEADGNTNINCQTGSLLFWFKPDWSSADVGGNGPGHWGRLIETGDNDPDLSNNSWMADSTNGWWALYLSPDGTQLSFGTSTNGGGMANLSANISWFSNEWYQIALTYSPAGSALYVDGELLADGAGVACHPDTDELANGFRVGSDLSGSNQAEGAFDELQIFDYPLSPATAATYDSQIPDWWEVKYFGRAGLDPEFQPAGDGFTLLLDYLRGRDPNVIGFSLSATNRYVNTNTVPVQINVISGEPSFMAIMIDNTNPPDARYQPFGTTLNFSNAAWQPYHSNIIALLNAGDGDYNVWVGVKGFAPDAQPAWQWMLLIRDTVPPVLVVTNPVAGLVARPTIQLQGYADKSLGSLTYDVSNAAGIWTNQEGYITGQFCDTTLRAITTNWFQCYDIVLATNGPNVLTLHAADLAGNPFTTNLSFAVDYSMDTNPPLFVLSWPQDGMAISGTNFVLRGSVSDPTATVTISITGGDGSTNIISGTVTRDGEVWANNVPLGNGTNTVTVATADAAGNYATNFAVWRNDVGLTLNPLARDQLNQSLVTISGSVGNSGGTIVVNGQTAAVKGDGTWTANYVPVNSSGPAIFNAAIYDSDDNLIGSQSFFQTEPASVVLESFSLTARRHYFDWGWPYDGWVGLYNSPQGIAGPVFENGLDEVQWTYQSGGVEVGYYFNTGAIWGLSGTGYSPLLDYIWDQILSPGENLVLSRYSSDLFAGAPWEITSGARSTVMIKPPGPAVAGKTVTYMVEAQAWGLDSMGGYENMLPPDSLRIRGQSLMPVPEVDGSVWGQTVVQAPAGAKVDVTPLAFGSYHFDVQAKELGLQIAVDNNRDGQITFDGSDQTSAANPYRFWINNTQEHGDDETSEGEADDQVPGIAYNSVQQPVYPNFSHSRVQGRSDLVNFFPVALCLSNTLQLLPPSSGYEYHLYDADSGPLCGAVKFVYTSLTPTNTFDYLTDVTATAGYGVNSDEPAQEADTIRVNPDTTLDTNWLAQVQNTGGMGIILVEGCAVTPHPLMLEIWRNGKLLGGTPLYLSISPVEQMFRHKNLMAASGGTGGVPDRLGDSDVPNEPPASDGKNLVFLHGYNVNPNQARGVLSEMFKRFYWSGSKAKFYGVTWNGADSQVLNYTTPNYHTNVMHAVLTAPALAGFLGTLPGDTTVTAHSLGNIVVLSALNDFSARITKYFMIDAAVPIEALDGSAATDEDMMNPSWNGYDTRLWASEWHSLFPTNDARSTLTWRDRFSNFNGAEVYNFYSSGEEVLRTQSGSPPAGLVSALSDQALAYLRDEAGAFTWVWQEKCKGIMLGNTLIGSDYGGWGFNFMDGYLPQYPVWYVGLSGGRRVRTPSEIGIVTTDLLNGSQFNPLFDTGWGGYDANSPGQVFVTTDTQYFTGPNWILGLYQAESGSAIAADPVKNIQLLADAFPAMTLPVGANHVDKFHPQNEDDRNIDMQASFENGWPSSRGPVRVGTHAVGEWHHSDFCYVAYPFTRWLFEQVVTLGNLK